MKEIWKDIPGLEGRYQISSEGRVYSLLTSKILATQINKVTGYCHVGVWLAIGKRKTMSIHQAVTSAFLGECPKGHEVNHKNGVKTDNSIKNLEYVTRSKNMKHAYKYLDRAYQWKLGEDHKDSKLNNKKVKKIREMYHSGDYMTKEIAAMFDVSSSAICDVIAGRTWSHVK